MVLWLIASIFDELHGCLVACTAHGRSFIRCMCWALVYFGTPEDLQVDPSLHAFQDSDRILKGWESWAIGCIIQVICRIYFCHHPAASYSRNIILRHRSSSVEFIERVSVLVNQARNFPSCKTITSHRNCKLCFRYALLVHEFCVNRFLIEVREQILTTGGC